MSVRFSCVCAVFEACNTGRRASLFGHLIIKITISPLLKRLACQNVFNTLFESLLDLLFFFCFSKTFVLSSIVIRAHET